jgi:catechol-2,3-dioxygenase
MATGLLTATDAPLHVGHVTLAARDATALARFYETVIGLERLGATSDGVELGAGASGSWCSSTAPLPRAMRAARRGCSTPHS